MSHLPISAWGIVLKLFVMSASSCSVMLSAQQQHLNLCTWSHKSRPRESAFKAVIGKGESLLVNIAFYEVLPSGHPGCNWNPIGFLNKWNLTHPFFFVLPLDFLNFLAILINSEFTKRSWVQRQQVQGLLIQELSSSSGKVSIFPISNSSAFWHVGCRHRADVLSRLNVVFWSSQPFLVSYPAHASTTSAFNFIAVIFARLLPTRS